MPPPIVHTSEDPIEAYLEYLNSLIVFSIISTFSPAYIPVFRELYQIPARVRIRALGLEERGCYYVLGEVCFYESAFEHGLLLVHNSVRKCVKWVDLIVTRIC